MGIFHLGRDESNLFDDAIVTNVITWNVIVANYLYQSLRQKESNRNTTRAFVIAIITYFTYHYIGSCFPNKGVSTWLKMIAKYDLVFLIIFTCVITKSKVVNNVFEQQQKLIYHCVIILINIYVFMISYDWIEYHTRAIMINLFLLFFVYPTRKLLVQIRTFKKLSIGNEIDLEEETTCTICQEQITHAVQLKCGHAFHRNCLLEWAEKSTQCPLCHKTIQTSDKPLHMKKVIEKELKKMEKLKEKNENDMNKNKDKKTVDNDDNEIDNWEVNEITN